MSFKGKVYLFVNYIKIIISDIFSRILQSRTDENGKVIFDLKDVRLSVYYFYLIHSFHDKGYKIFIKNNIKFIANWVKSDRHIFNFPNVRIHYGTSKLKYEEWVYIYDRFVEPDISNWKKNIFISCDVYATKPSDLDWVQAPFSMAPHQYLNGQYKEVKSLRGSIRRIKIFFSGNLDYNSYTSSIFKDFFKVLNRIEIINELKNNLPSHQIEYSFPDNSTHVNKLILLDWSWSEGKSENIRSRIENKKWLAALSRSDFFLATPGILMPMCFNIIEAMSVGSIPVLEFSNHFYPPLVHMKNAIIFNGKDDLLVKVNMVFDFSEEIIKELRDGVIEYYDNFLYPTAIPDLIECEISGDGKLYLHATKASYDDHIRNY